MISNNPFFSAGLWTCWSFYKLWVCVNPGPEHVPYSNLLFSFAVIILAHSWLYNALVDDKMNVKRECRVVTGPLILSFWTSNDTILHCWEIKNLNRESCQQLITLKKHTQVCVRSMYRHSNSYWKWSSTEIYCFITKKKKNCFVKSGMNQMWVDSPGFLLSVTV